MSTDYIGRHRRTAAATDQALCHYRDDAEAMFGTYYYGTHAGEVEQSRRTRRQLSAMQQAGTVGPILLSQQLNGGVTD